VGVAPTKLLAKLASAAAKPDGLLAVRAGEEAIAFLHGLPVEALWGVGERTHEVLSRLGARTVGDLAKMPVRILEGVLGHQAARHLAELAAGRDDRPVIPYESPKQISHEQTYEHDLDAEDQILRELLRLSFRVASRLRREGFRARTVILKARLASFATLTRSRTLADPTDTGADFFRTVAELYRAVPGTRRRIRLLGVAAGGLVAAGAEQLALVRAGRWDEAERALDRIESRFGPGTAFPAALLEGD
jgi:DNA polymerase IV